MTADKCESLHFYKYLCQKIGSEEDVRNRRLAYCISDILEISEDGKIYSGSKAEGLDLKGSDLDVMFIDTNYKVYESETEVILDGLTIPLIMNTEETQPCFTQLRLLNFHRPHQNFKYMWQKSHLGYMLSSEEYKQVNLPLLPSLYRWGNKWRIHGPCLSDNNEQLDLAHCLKCDKWIFKAQPWIIRPRKAWPLPEIISKIISFGVLFVPIGCKGSVNENLEWRISFSVAEKLLIFSFNHTQLFCYALLKILLKEIVEKHEYLKGLLCSYFLKTLLFWISEETDPNVWRPDNIIPCFMACLQRLMYCVRYSILLHYFIPDNNLFCSRFNVINKEKLETILKNLYEQRINCFASSETLKYYERHTCNITESFTSENFIKIRRNGPSFLGYANMKIVLYHCLHYSRTDSSRDLLALYLSKACQSAPDASKYGCSPENKQQYYKYKYDRSHLLIGVHSDAVSGWLTLASFFYVHKRYVDSLRVINYALQKYTDEKIFTGLSTFLLTFIQKQKYKMNLMDKEYTLIQKQVLNLMKKETNYTVLKAITIEALMFNSGSLIIPQELQLVAEELHFYHPLPFAYFLSFLCYYQLHDSKSCRHYLQQLTSIISICFDSTPFAFLSTPIMCGIAHTLIGETYFAKQIFQSVIDKAPRLSWLSSVV
ncbi:uncharacterized protein [Mytilus edulis]|uniref:uncharacterized protein n=1 Tax=Mytilus edulis TaxID=6550 RepID=UPI0039EF2727